MISEPSFLINGLTLFWTDKKGNLYHFNKYSKNQSQTLTKDFLLDLNWGQNPGTGKYFFSFLYPHEVLLNEKSKYKLNNNVLQILLHFISMLHIFFFFFILI